MDKLQYWHERAKTYANLDWVRDNHSLQMITEVMQFSPGDIVLDVGTGLGAVAMTIIPFVDKVIGIDNSHAMLCQAEKMDGVFYMEWDVRKPLFAPGILDKVMMRQVLHHIHKDDVQSTVGLYNKVLRTGGKFAVIEAVCPSEAIQEDCARIFELKDGRNVLTVGDIVGLMQAVGFVNIETTPFTMAEFSVKNWLSNNALEQATQDRLFEMHITADDVFKQAYNMRIINGDCLIDVQNVIVVGEKA